MTMALQISQLFEDSRLRPGGVSLTKFILYFPLGFTLMIMRTFFLFFFGLFTFCVPSKLSPYVFRCLGPLLGIGVRIKNQPPLSQARVFVSNHVTEADAMAFAFAFPISVLMYRVAGSWLRFTPFNLLDPIFVPRIPSGSSSSQSLQSIPSSLSALDTSSPSSPPSAPLAPSTSGSGAQPESATTTTTTQTPMGPSVDEPEQAKPHLPAVDRSSVRHAIAERLAERGSKARPIVNFPEGGLTNGTVGIMQFHKYIFGLGEPICPVSIRIVGPLQILALDTLSSTFLGNMFTILFLPIRIYELHFLPVMTRNEGETEADFAKRCQQAIANDLGIQATNFSYRNKKEYIMSLSSSPSKSNQTAPMSYQPKPEPPKAWDV